MKVNKSFWICLGVMAAAMLLLPWVLFSFAGPTDLMGVAWLVRRSRRDLCGAAAAAAVEPAGLVRPFVPSGRVAGFLYG